jgi:D-alanyl-D-alanine carboxypeptidase
MLAAQPRHRADVHEPGSPALATGTLLTPATQALRLKTRVLSQVPQLTTSYGLGIYEWNGFLGHAGAILGYGSMAIYLPARDAIIVAVGNQCGLADNSPPELIALSLAAYLVPEQFPRGIRSGQVQPT